MSEDFIKQKIIETLFNTFSPIKVLLDVNKIPKSFWEDDYLFGLFSVFITTEITIGFSILSKFDNFNEILFDIIKKIDPDNFEFILSKMAYTAQNQIGELKLGGDVAELILYLKYNENKKLFPNVKENNEDILDAKSNKNIVREVMNLSKIKFGSIDEINDNAMAAFYLFDLKVLGYMRKKYDIVS